MFGARWSLGVLTAGAMTLLTSHVPFRNGLGLDVVVNRMAAVAKGSGRARGVCLRIELGPPVGAHRDVVRPQHLMSQVPLRAKREIVVAYLLEIPLLPLGAVNHRNLSLLKHDPGISLRHT